MYTAVAVHRSSERWSRDLLDEGVPERAKGDPGTCGIDTEKYSRYGRFATIFMTAKDYRYWRLTTWLTGEDGGEEEGEHQRSRYASSSHGPSVSLDHGSRSRENIERASSRQGLLLWRFFV